MLSHIHTVCGHKIQFLTRWTAPLVSTNNHSALLRSQKNKRMNKNKIKKSGIAIICMIREKVNVLTNDLFFQFPLTNHLILITLILLWHVKMCGWKEDENCLNSSRQSLIYQWKYVQPSSIILTTVSSWLETNSSLTFFVLWWFFPSTFW